jgi:RNA polymerase sigma-70 factor (ECF subfamily)
MHRPRERSPRLALVSGSTGAAPPNSIAAPGRDFPEIDWAILMARAQAGDRDAYRRLLKGVTPYVRSLAIKAHRDPNDVEDTVQDVLFTLHSIRNTYDPSRPFGPWLLAIANRRIVDRLRHQRRARRYETPLAAEHENLANPDGNRFEENSDSATLHAAVDSLPPGQRQAVTLMKLHELTLLQAADVSGTSIAALKGATHRALRTMRKFFTRPDSKP